MKEHEDMVLALSKPGEEIVATMTPRDAHLMHMAIGIAGEAGELLDAIKKSVIYRKPIDLINVIEELGDLEFFMSGLRQELRIARLETLAHNIQKLSKGRYKSGTYTDQQAQERADKP